MVFLVSNVSIRTRFCNKNGPPSDIRRMRDYGHSEKIRKYGGGQDMPYKAKWEAAGQMESDADAARVH